MRQRALLISLLTLSLSQGCSDPASPRIDAILPARGNAGDIVHVVGEPFEHATLQVAFGGRPARLLERQPRRAIVEVPAGLSGLVMVVVSVEGRVSTPFDFWVDDAPRGDGGAP